MSSEPALVARIRQARGEAQADRGPAWLLRRHADLRGDGEVFDVARVVPGEVEQIRQRRRPARLTESRLYATTVKLELGGRADAEAHAERRQAQEVAFEARHRIEHRPLKVESALEEDEAEPNRLRVFGHEGAAARTRR